MAASTELEMEPEIWILALAMMPTKASKFKAKAQVKDEDRMPWNMRKNHMYHKPEVLSMKKSPQLTRGYRDYNAGPDRCLATFKHLELSKGPHYHLDCVGLDIAPRDWISGGAEADHYKSNAEVMTSSSCLTSSWCFKNASWDTNSIHYLQRLNGILVITHKPITEEDTLEAWCCRDKLGASSPGVKEVIRKHAQGNATLR
ncbi:hypothetical protein BDZ97DRAFT_1760691 [Flammula alnicola]|nr:hypothetical protein BDZ97DRAFT_1760691 [Flammula alnicola]